MLWAHVANQVHINLVCANWAHLEERKTLRKLLTNGKNLWYTPTERNFYCLDLYNIEGKNKQITPHSTIHATKKFQVKNFEEHSRIYVAENIHKLQINIEHLKSWIKGFRYPNIMIVNLWGPELFYPMIFMSTTPSFQQALLYWNRSAGSDYQCYRSIHKKIHKKICMKLVR